MPKFPYRKAGAAWDRVFRNDHNQNLDDIAEVSIYYGGYIDTFATARIYKQAPDRARE
ncbi:hypothetical protein [Bacillus amyloliquefaciens]|uniref:hypothetical protein n=1 Tax=Bacillus amyloliquefaciens TaxID=1390 RepID=UPI00187CB728|nr:hypothetical protein [Bacillus amyloliquefaciens]